MGARIMCRAAVAAGILLLGPTVCVTQGQSGTWIATTGAKLWSGTGNWQSGIVANGIDGVADFSTLNLTADNTVELDSSRTIGALMFGDTVPSNNWFLDNNLNSNNVLTLAVSSGSPTITVNNQTATLFPVLS